MYITLQSTSTCTCICLKMACTPCNVHVQCVCVQDVRIQYIYMHVHMFEQLRRLYLLLMCITYMYLSSILQFGCWKHSTSDCNHFSINRNTKILYIWVSIKISPCDLAKQGSVLVNAWIHMYM